MRKDRKLTMTRRFYVGSLDMARHFHETGKTADNMGTLPEMMDKASEMVEDGKDCVFIVEVVKVVRREQTPVIIESTR